MVSIMNMKVSAVCVIICVSFWTTDASADYYWRDYTGVIPKDAVPGGVDLNNDTTYIGQGFVKDYGIIPGIIYPGKTEITVPIYGAKKIDSYIKILCSVNLSAFKWVPVNANELYRKFKNKHLVTCGLENNNVLYLGRILFQGNIVVGKIFGGSPKNQDSLMYFIDKNNEKLVRSYEALIYEPVNFQIDVRFNKS